ncbi:MAG: carboxymuconolactone decarboxylase family protein [Dehalococcoidia bacterium]|nr:MAG: carboxymuconolactone decarboxylase family protein [Dehalococcoidia bacterium]
MARVSLLEKEQAALTFREVYQGSEERSQGVLNIVKLLANCPQMGLDYLRFAGAVLRGEGVPMKLRELATLRVGSVAGADYEFLHHIPLGLIAGLTRKQIDDINTWEESSEFNEQERAVLLYTDQVARDNNVTDETFAKLQSFFSEHDIVELTLVIGYFVMLCRILVALQLELEPGFSPE